MIIGLFPGQGSQTPGFLSPWLEIDGVRARLESYADAAQVDLIAAGTEWDADAIRDTKVAQPLIVAASLLSWHALRERTAAAPSGVAGHSVGEIAALTAAEVLTDDEALRLVGIRGRAMADAAALEQTGMSAVLGGDEQTVLARLAELDLAPANHNGGGQIVARLHGGTRSALRRRSARNPRHPAAGGRSVPHPLHASRGGRPRRGRPQRSPRPSPSGRCGRTGRHRRHLRTARAGPSGRPGGRARALGSVHGVVRRARRHRAHRIRPAGTLTGLAKRALRGVPSVAVKTPDDLDAAVALLTEENA
ncbi:ACP S-malonyltransferase [Microbacterium caowuchunii]|uniref:ACP S-malonyltransferase n=1 Tax=Microbacterium caowuchunii TaxID=2614638 RepID=UPI0023AF6132|nr:acyltransferase domain-containing protein [Microbacterium caowuchunii]